MQSIKSFQKIHYLIVNAQKYQLYRESHNKKKIVSVQFQLNIYSYMRLN